MSKILIVIPVYNEAERLDKKTFLSHLSKHHDQHILFVNDGSSDNSYEVIEDLRKSAKGQVHTLSLTTNQGKAEAIRKGILKIREKKKDADFFGYIDADLATPLSQVEYIINKLKVDESKLIAFGSREKKTGNDIQRNIWRHYLGRIFAAYSSLLLSLRIYDTQCGAKFFRATATNYGLFEEHLFSRWFFDIEIFLRLRKIVGDENFYKSIIEIPLLEWQEKGNTKLKLKDFLLTPFVLLLIKRKYRK